ncbi:hypothetical protein [Chryseobacterium sp. G0201]|uniref:hypothetical protein n=1 Tax=Chryseobacterium sp. G0201 TaxID=2487065 RepID=UPI000F50E868|nr:hypothetical protein [Chryseobacterium sp. G0201]AZA52914.1 hypothetical protein EG348_07775 [Chryseobacterium sp. G0201]
MLLRELKKGVKELFAKLKSFIDEVFGFGEKVGDHALTPAEKRWKDKHRKIQKKLERKKDPAKTKRIKQHEDFVEKWSGKSIRTLTKIEIANSLKGFTEQGNKIAKLIEDGEMLFEILNESTFKMAYLESGGKLSNYKKYRIEAFSYGDINYFREDKSIESFMSELIHEGTHTLDYLEEQRLFELGKSEAEIDKILGDIYSFEKRAYFHERAFQIATEMDVEYKTIESMLEHIFYTYP